MADPFRVVFVCTGNSCRSPMAEAMLKQHLAEQEVGGEYEVCSAGTSASDGMPASSKSVATCAKYSVEMNGFQSSALSQDICEAAHLIVALDHSHRQCIDELYPQCSDRVRMLASFLTSDPNRLSIADPIGSEQDVYDKVGEVIYLAVEQMAKNWHRLVQRFYESRQLVVAIGADHRGYEAKAQLIETLQNDGLFVADCGTDSQESCDHPDFAIRVAELVALGDADRGILICGSGHGMIITANKVPSIRAVMPLDEKHAIVSRQHNNSNVAAFGADFMDMDRIVPIVSAWLKEPFLGGRYQHRINKISNYEQFLRC